VAHQVLAPGEWPLRMIVAITTDQSKPVGSRRAMEQTSASSPLYEAWVASHGRDLSAARGAILARDLGALGDAMERSCLGMHAVMLTACPPLLYWNAATVEVIRAVRRLRTEGTRAWFTIDAGPHVKVLCAAEDAGEIAAALETVSGVRRAVVASPGEGARLERAP
jgi:diphosphomevalonate decarboxylase